MSKTRRMLKAAKRFNVSSRVSTTKAEIEYISTHESGHALLAHMFDLDYEYVFVGCNRLEDGRTSDGGLLLSIKSVVNETQYGKRLFGLIGFMSSFLAGGYATWCIFNTATGTGYDEEQFDSFYADYQEECRRNEIKVFPEDLFRATAQGLTKKFKVQISRLAAHLSVKGKLLKSEVEEILHDVPKLESLNMFLDFMRKDCF